LQNAIIMVPDLLLANTMKCEEEVVEELKVNEFDHSSSDVEPNNLINLFNLLDEKKAGNEEDSIAIYCDDYEFEAGIQK
jgi:hypothetical protein